MWKFTHPNITIGGERQRVTNASLFFAIKTRISRSPRTFSSLSPLLKSTIEGHFGDHV